MTNFSRRGFLAMAGAAAAGRALVAQAGQSPPASPPSVVSNPPRDFGPGATTTYFNDPDVLTIDPAFDALVQANAAIVRLWTGALWAEGPAWNAQGRYLV